MKNGLAVPPPAPGNGSSTLYVGFPGPGISQEGHHATRGLSCVASVTQHVLEADLCFPPFYGQVTRRRTRPSLLMTITHLLDQQQLNTGVGKHFL